MLDFFDLPICEIVCCYSKIVHFFLRIHCKRSCLVFMKLIQLHRGPPCRRTDRRFCLSAEELSRQILRWVFDQMDHRPRFPSIKFSNAFNDRSQTVELASIQRGMFCLFGCSVAVKIAAHGGNQIMLRVRAHAPKQNTCLVPFP